MTPPLQSDERTHLLESGDFTPAVRAIDTYLTTESEIPIDTSPPEVPQAVKELMLFSNYGYAAEAVAFVLTTFLGFKYVFSGCILVGGCMLGAAFSTGWLCVPQLALPFVSNPIIRWFIVTNHSHHVTGMMSILAAVVVLSYFAWTNTCLAQSVSIRSSTITVLTLCSAAIVLFLIACYRDEKGNAGYIRWIIKLVF